MAKETQSNDNSAPFVRLFVAWIWVGIPLIWGLTETIIKAAVLFQ